MLQTLPVLLLNARKPVIGRKNLPRFMACLLPYTLQADSILVRSRVENLLNRSQLPDCQGLTDYLVSRGHTQIGLMTGGNFPEYYLWAMLRRRLRQGFRIEHLQSNGLKPDFHAGPFAPTVIISQDDQADSIDYAGMIFRKSAGAHLSLFVYER